LKKKRKKKLAHPNPKEFGKKNSQAIDNFTKKRFLIYLPFILMFILSLIYFAPLLSGEKMMYGSDWLLGGYSKHAWSIRYISQHKEIPMWFPHIFGGCPTISAFFGDLLSPHTLLYLLFPIHIVWSYLFVFYTFLAGIGVYLLFKELKLGYFPSFLAGVCYMFSGPLISTTFAGHLGRAISVALLPFMLLFILKGVIRQKFYFFIFFAGISALSFLTGHFQMTYYAMGLSIFFFIFLLVGRRKQLKSKTTLQLSAFFILGIVVLGLLVSISFLPVMKNLGFGTRGATKGYDYTTSWSMPTAELIDLFVPQFSGMQEHYWGENYFKLHSEYIGILPLLFLLFGLIFYFKERNVKFFLVIGLVALFLALGKNTPVFKLAYYLVPGIKKFRAPSLIFYILSFSIILIAAYGLKGLLEQKNKKKIILSSLIFIGCYIIFALIAIAGKNGFISFLKSHFSYLLSPQNTMKLKAFTENYPHFEHGIGKALLVSLAGFGLIYLFIKTKIKLAYLIIGLGIVMLIDQWVCEKRFLKTNPPPSQYYRKDDVISYLENDKSLYRVFPLQYQRSNDGILFLHDIQSLGGYHPNPLRRYQELIGAGESVMFTPINFIKFPKLLNIVNGKYIIGLPLPEDTTRYDAHSREAIRQLKNYYSQFTLVHRGQYAIYKNNSCLPRAFFVNNYKVIKNKDDVLKFMENEKFDPSSLVLLEENPDFNEPDTSIPGSNIKITDYTANRITLDIDAKTNGFLVLSENYYPRWHAYVDNKENKIYIADYTLRAIPITSGNHKVVLKYEDRSYNLGKTFNIIGDIILLFSFVFQFFRRKENIQKINP